MEKKTNHLVVSIICGLMTAFGIVASIISLIGKSHTMWLCDCGSLVIIALILYYAFKGYKKPHGNLMKYILLVHAILRLLGILATVSTGNVISVILRSIGIGLSCYIAGRLVKAKENLILMVISTLFLVAELISDIVVGISAIGVVTPLIIWIDICVAYFLRYKEHREAGLTYAPKK